MCGHHWAGDYSTCLPVILQDLPWTLETPFLEFGATFTRCQWCNHHPKSMNILTLKIWQVNSYLKFCSVWDAMILQSKGRKIPFLVFAKWENHTTFVIYQFYNISWPLKIKWKLLQILNWNLCLAFKCKICTLQNSLISSVHFPPSFTGLILNET